MASSGSSPTVPDACGPQKVSFLSSEVPIKVVTVYKDKAQITRVVSFSAATTIGLHEVELTGLPNRALIEEHSLAIKGSGHCTILDFSFSTEKPSPPPVVPKADAEEKRKEAEARKEQEVKNSKLKEMEAARDKEMQAMMEKHVYLGSQYSRNERLRQMANRVGDNAASAFAPPGGNTCLNASGAAAATPGSMDIDGVSKALDWWEKKSTQVDEECHRLTLAGTRLADSMAKIGIDHAAAVAAMSKQNSGVVAKETRPRVAVVRKPNSSARVVVTVDVEELHCPIELEVSYMTRGATWSPSYDLRVDTQTDSISCTYYGRVSQRTTEDWNGVALKLSTAEPSARSTPPSLGTKTVSLKPPAPVEPPPANFHGPASGFVYRGASPTCAFGASQSQSGSAAGFGGFGTASAPAGGTFGGAFGVSKASAPCAPPPPPKAKAAVAQVEGGGGGMGAVSFAVEKPASIKSNGETKKLPVGVLQLSTEVIHYIVPSKEPAAYLQAKATNNTDYLLLASGDVSIFFDNSFVSKTSIASVSPGESFQTFLGIDPAVKTEVAPPRKTAKTKGLFGKVDHVTHTHRTSISNKKKVPVTCVLVEAMPRSTDEIIKVTLQKPAPAKVSEAADAINDEKLVDTALHMFRGGGDGDGDAGVSAKASTAVLKVVKTDVVGVAKGPTNHLAWVVTIAPQDDISIPLEYTVEWPIGKEVVFGD